MLDTTKSSGTMTWKGGRNKIISYLVHDNITRVSVEDRTGRVLRGSSFRSWRFFWHTIIRDWLNNGGLSGRSCAPHVYNEIRLVYSRRQDRHRRPKKVIDTKTVQCAARASRAVGKLRSNCRVVQNSSYFAQYLFSIKSAKSAFYEQFKVF